MGDYTVIWECVEQNPYSEKWRGVQNPASVDRLRASAMRGVVEAYAAGRPNALKRDSEPVRQMR